MIEAPLFLVLFPVAVIWVVWMIFFLANDPSEEFRQLQHHEFLGPGGPDDPFARDQDDGRPPGMHPARVDEAELRKLPSRGKRGHDVSPLDAF